MDELDPSVPQPPPGRPDVSSESFIKVFGPNLLAFGMGLALAYFLEWELTDLVWSLWLSSLVVGYLTILSTAGGTAYFGIQLIRQPEFDPSHRAVVIIAGLGFGLFYIGFFSLHFCGFHAGHSVFLNAFFPVEGVPQDGFGAAFMNPLLLWKLVFQYLLLPYGIFLIPALIVEREHLIAPFKTPSFDLTVDKMNRKKKGAKGLGDGMLRPYANVIRMHLLIFFFAGCHLLKVDSFLVYVVVSLVYFFPWRDLKKFRQGRKNAQSTYVE